MRLYVWASCYQLLTLKCTAFLVVSTFNITLKLLVCVLVSVLWFSVCALYVCVCVQAETMARSDYISVRVEGGIVGRGWTPTGYPSRPFCPSRSCDWLRPRIYLQHGFIKTHYKFQTQRRNRPLGLESRSYKTQTSVGFYTSEASETGCSIS